MTNHQEGTEKLRSQSQSTSDPQQGSMLPNGVDDGLSQELVSNSYAEGQERRNESADKEYLTATYRLQGLSLLKRVESSFLIEIFLIISILALVIFIVGSGGTLLLGAAALGVLSASLCILVLGRRVSKLEKDVIETRENEINETVQLNERIRRLEIQVDHLQVENRRLGQENHRLQGASQELFELLRELSEQQARMKQLEAQVEQLVRDNQHFQVTSRELAERFKQLIGQQIQVDQLETENKRLGQEHYQLQVVSQELIERLRELFDQQVQIKQLEAQVGQLVRDNQQLQTVSQELLVHLNQVIWQQAQIKQLEAQVGQFVRDNQQFQVTNQELAEHLNQLLGQQAQIKQLEAEITRFGQDLRQNQKKNQEFEELLRQLEDLVKQAPLPPKRATIRDRVLEPADPSDLLEHPHLKIFPISVEERNILRYGWHIIGASRRGDNHAYYGKYREDDFNIRFVSARNGFQGQDITLVAIADGLGGSEYSRRGARAVVLGATERIEEGRLRELARYVQQNPGQGCIDEAQSILMEACAGARDSVKQRAIEDHLEIKDLHSTLLVFLAIPCDRDYLFIASTQIGDGALYALAPGQVTDKTPGAHWQILQKQQIQGVGNEVESFMHSKPNMWEAHFQCIPRLNATFIMGMTDGTADDIQPPPSTQEIPDPDHFLYVHRFYKTIRDNALSQNAPAASLGTFLDYQKKQSSDDRTIVCLYNSSEGR